MDEAGQSLHSHLANQRQRVRETAQQAAHHRGEQHLVTASLKHTSHETVPLKGMANQRQRVRETAQQAAHKGGEQHLVTPNLNTILMRLSL